MIQKMTEQKISQDLWNEFNFELEKIKCFDISILQLTPETNSALDLFFKKFCDSNEIFPEGARHSVIEKNFAIFIVKNKIPLQQIQEAYKSKGFNFTSLRSQINGVLNGTYPNPNISVGELVNWCKEFRPDLSKMFETSAVVKRENPFKKLHYATNHLLFFHEFNSLVGLYGRHYTPILKARYYQLLGGIIQQPLRIGNLNTDTRVCVAYPLPTEAGKNDLIYAIKDLINTGILKSSGKNFTMSEPASFHPEQLIGKFIEIQDEIENERTGRKKRIKRRVENRGHLNNDFLEFDECTDLITSIKPELKQAREILSKAENPLGRNEVQKRLVEDTPENIVKYCPVCTSSYYFQPFKKIPEEAFLQGFLRRKLIPVGNVNVFLNFADESAYNDKLSDAGFNRIDYKKRFIEFLESIRNFVNQDLDILFSEEAIKLISDYSLLLSKQAQIHSEKIANFSKITKYTTLSYLTKMSAIISISYHKQIVDKNSVCLAYMDLVELFQNTLDFVYERTYGDFSYGTSWGGANYKQKQCMQFLLEHKAFSKETSGVTIEDFINVVKEIFEVGEQQASSRYKEMKKNNLIDSSQIGQHDSAVWLKFNPFEQKNLLEGDEGYKGYTTYNMVFQQLNTIIQGLLP